MEKFLDNNNIAYKVNDDKILVSVPSIIEWLTGDNNDTYEDFTTIAMNRIGDKEYALIEAAVECLGTIANVKAPKRLTVLLQAFFADRYDKRKRTKSTHNPVPDDYNTMDKPFSDNELRGSVF